MSFFCLHLSDGYLPVGLDTYRQMAKGMIQCSTGHIRSMKKNENLRITAIIYAEHLKEVQQLSGCPIEAINLTNIALCTGVHA